MYNQRPTLNQGRLYGDFTEEYPDKQKSCDEETKMAILYNAT